ncbi:MAG: 2Fe-2S iron-sulfur cluster binding domain-containing protein [Gammaproteobacteria bacterium]|nr:2Fe-2S iron-sulfur cluster binding domain-containing protein [Gammaproteobacteria bacterium]
MSFTITVQPSGYQFSAAAETPILDSLLKSGASISYGCRGGFCGACKGELISGNYKYGEDPMGLSAEDKASQKLLLCVAHPRSDMVIKAEVNPTTVMKVQGYAATISSMQRMNDEVMLLGATLNEEKRLPYLAGQYVEFITKDGLTRAFSIANAPHDDRELRFHIRRIRGGKFTDTLFATMQIGDNLDIVGPHGSFYIRENSQAPIIMLATGTGFGPIKAMVEHLIAEKSTRPLYIYWGARARHDLYLESLAEKWDAEQPHIHFRPVLSKPDATWQGRCGHVQQAVMADFTDLSGYELYACGHPEMVKTAVSELKQLGLAAESCFSDAFEFAPK